MPRFTRRKKYRKKKAYRRKGRINRRYNRRKKAAPSVWGVRKAIQYVPDRVRVKMPFVALYKVESGSGADIVFRGNSVWDPVFALGGSQPLGFTQWANFYNKYKVSSSSISVYSVPYATIAASHKLGDLDVEATFGQLIVYPSNGSSSFTYDPKTAEVPYGKSRLIDQRRVGVKHYMTTRKIMGTRLGYEDSICSVSGADPTHQWYWHVVYNPLNVAGDPAGIKAKVIVRIVYYVEWFDRFTTLPTAEDDNETKTGYTGYQGYQGFE